MREDSDYKVGAPVVYVNQYGRPQNALVLIWWNGGVPASQFRASNGEPGCNLVLVSEDETKNDPCGRQIERETSVVHKSRQSAHGRYWRWPEEE